MGGCSAGSASSAPSAGSVSGSLSSLAGDSCSAVAGSALSAGSAFLAFRLVKYSAASRGELKDSGASAGSSVVKIASLPAGEPVSSVMSVLLGLNDSEAFLALGSLSELL